MKINYISNIPHTELSGGGSGVNRATIQQLNKYFDVVNLPPINPGIDLISKVKSVLLRQLNIKGNYHFYSKKRLYQINNEFLKKTKKKETDAFFFHGFTPWIKTSPNKPYFCFNDACFATYVSIYNNPLEFRQKDLDRIFKQEAQWLSNAKKVFFRSQWALNETKRHYQLDGQNFRNVGVGGFIDIPERDEYTSGFNFLFISREFIPKGGLVVVKALEIVKKIHSEVNLWIVGQEPPQNRIMKDTIIYKGFYNKGIPSQKVALIDLFKNSFALVHPTLKDTNTLVINELAYYGCPAIASSRFAIPEYLLDKKTGFLLNDPTDSDELAQKMIRMIESSTEYLKMRKAARENALQNNTWQQVGNRIANEIKESLKT